MMATVREFRGGLLPPDPVAQERYMRLYNAASLDIKAPDVVEVELYYPPAFVPFYDQVGGTCVGFSSCVSTSVRYSQPGNDHKFSGIECYKQCRREMGVPPDEVGDLSAGATMESAGKALRNWGNVEVIGNTNQPHDLRWGVESYYWGTSVDQIRAFIAQGYVVQLGIGWYSEFQSPVSKVDPVTGKVEQWIGTHTSLGGLLGLHAVTIRSWLDHLDAGRLQNTWGDDYGNHGNVLIGRKTINRLLSVGGQILLCIPKIPTPPISLEMVDTLTIQPQEYGKIPVAQFSIRNAGAAAVHLAGIGVREKGNSANDIGYLPLDLAPGETVPQTLVGTKALSYGSYDYRVRYQSGGVWTELGNNVTFSVQPPPPEPDPDTITITGLTIKARSSTYLPDHVDASGNVIFNKRP